MDVIQTDRPKGSLQISSEVVEKIAEHAAMEVAGVKAVENASTGTRGLLDKLAPTKPIQVEMKEAVADITMYLVVGYGAKIPELSEQVQQNVKNSVQNMTNITVARVNVVVTGVALNDAE